jgi:hypothetical protein
MKRVSRELLPSCCRKAARVSAGCISLCLGLAMSTAARAQVFEPAPPPPPMPDYGMDAAPGPGPEVSPLLPPPDGGGFFPTISETALLRGPYDARSFGGAFTADSPDRITQNATDIFPYESTVPNFYQRNPQIFKPLDHFFGFFTPFDTLTYENDRLRNFAFSLDANLGVLSRAYSPELAMVKAGPLYLDVLWIGTGVIFSDFNGPQVFPAGSEDGWVGYVELGLRLSMRITDTIYLTAGANLMYLPWENKFAFRALTGGFPSLGATVAFSDDWGPWSVNFANRFVGRPGLDFFTGLDEPGFDRAGRYWFGLQQARANEFFTEDFAFFSNTIEGSATRLVFGNQWRWWLNADHIDFWRTFDFTDHAARDHVGTLLGYEGSLIPFAPRLFYDVWDIDGLGRGRDSLLHRAGVGLTGRLTENIGWSGDAAYLFETGSDRRDVETFLWNMRFNHTVTRDFTQNLAFGQWLFFNDLFNEVLVSRYINYTANYRLGQRASWSVFAQYSDAELDLISGREQRRYGGGTALTFLPFDFTTTRLMAMWDTIDQPQLDYDWVRWILRAEITQRFSSRLTGNIFYQYENNDAGPMSFHEHAVGLSLRRYF